MFPFHQARPAPPRRWHHIRLEAPQLAERTHERVALLFNWVFMTAGRPREMGLWMTAPDDRDGANVYLSPRSAPLLETLIRTYNGVPCEPPVEAIVLIGGHGCQARPARRRIVAVRTTGSQRCFLPARYTCRTVRALEQRQTVDPTLQRNQVAPFARRFAEAWSLFQS